MGRERVSREVLDAHQRERVIAAVIPVFAKRGYQSTTVDDLLAAGKVGFGNFYSLFEGKEDCFLAAFESIVSSARDQIFLAAAPAQGWPEQAFLGLHEFLSLVAADPHSARIVLIEAQAAGAEGTRRYDALLDAATDWLGAGRGAAPRIDTLPPTFERSTIAGLAYYLQQCLFSGSVPAPEEFFDEVSSVILAPVIGAAELRRLHGALVSA